MKQNWSNFLCIKGCVYIRGHYLLTCERVSDMKLLFLIHLSFGAISISNHGVLFQNLGKIKYITAVHNSVISFNSQSIVNDGNALIDIIKDCKELVKKNSHYLQIYYLEMLDNIIKEFNVVFDKYKRYIANNNYKNVHSNENLDNVISEIENNSNSSNKEDIRIINSYISTINISKDENQKIAQAISRAILTRKGLNAHYFNDSHSLYNVSTELVMSFSLTLLDFCYRDFRDAIEQILYTFDSILTTSKTSILVIIPEYFQKLLRKLQDNSIPILYPSTNSFIPKYYDICHSLVKKVDDILFVIVQIPIGSSANYDLYGIHYMSVPIQNLPGWSRKLDRGQNKNYLAVSRDYTKYVFFDNLEDSCVSSSSTAISSRICTSFQQIQKSDEECLLFNTLPNITNHDKCNFIYEYNKKLEFKVIDNFWIGSVLKDQEESINEQCNAHLYSSNIRIKTGIIKIPVSSNCTYIGTNFILPKITNNIIDKNNNNNNDNAAHLSVKVILNPITLNFSPSVSNLFLNRKRSLTTIDIENIMATASFYSSSSSSSSFSFVNSTINFVIILVLFVFIITLAVLFIYYLCKTMTRKTLPPPPPSPPPPIVCQNQQYFQPPRLPLPPPPPPPPPPRPPPQQLHYYSTLPSPPKEKTTTTTDTYVSMT